jgi:hypothetical protein
MTTMTTTRPTFQPLADVPALPRPGTPRLVRIPARRCLQVDGKGAPADEAFKAAMGALYGTAYTLKFALKKAGRVTKVGALEGLWARTDDAPFPVQPDHPADPSKWLWTVLIEVPPEATDAEVQAAMESARAKRPSEAFERLRFGLLPAEDVVEVMHVGPYATEPATIELMQATMHAAGVLAVGPHHEIYLGNPNLAAPEKLRTILRQAVEPEG